MSTDRPKAYRQYQRDHSVPSDGRLKSARVDLGLAILEAVALPGMPYDRAEIAMFAGCTEAAIYKIEVNALKKLRVAFRIRKDRVLRELMEEFFQRRQCALPTREVAP